MNKLHTFLKIKQESLALEIKLIKKEMKRYKFDPVLAYQVNEYKEAAKATIHTGLSNHLHRYVRLENRATNIARAYLRGKPYSFVEPKLKKQYYWAFQNNNKWCVYGFEPYYNILWDRVVEIVRKYENTGSYYVAGQRKPVQETSDLVFAWRNEHPQLRPPTEKVEADAISLSASP